MKDSKIVKRRDVFIISHEKTGLSWETVTFDTGHARHIKKFHPDITDNDFKKIPALVRKSEKPTMSVTKSKQRAASFDVDGYNIVLAELKGIGKLEIVTFKRSK